MSHEEARRLVQLGLEHRRAAQYQAEREQDLEDYERDMITACNGNFAAAKETRQREAAESMSLALEAARQKEQRAQYAAKRRQERERLQKEMERDCIAIDCIRRFAFFCLITALVTVWTPFPWWAAVALVVGCTALVASYIFRVYFPAE